jgi:CHAD domain-containing protein
MAGSGPNPAQHAEVERKFDVDGSTARPSFDGVAAVARVVALPSQSLDAVYFDTPARDLRARRITLRRRTGGTDAGWHLKLPAGPETRTEMRTPLDDGTGRDDAVPAELRDVVLAVVRDRPLAPVMRIRTTRDVQALYGTDGAVLAEFCDDRVIASVGKSEHGWREWELELVNAPDAEPTADLLDRLGNRLLDSEAMPAEHGSKLARALKNLENPDNTSQAPPDAVRTADPVHRAVAEQVDEVLVWDRAVRGDVDDAVHQMRVTTRKIRSLLQASANSFGLSDDASILDELRWLAGLLGVARDAEVLAQRYRKALDRLPAQLVRGRVRERLVDGAAADYRAGLRTALAAMQTPRYFRLLDELDALVAEPPSTATAATAPVTIEAAYRRVRKAAKAAAGEGRVDAGSDEALHRIRKGAKRLRYTAAATDAPLVAKRAKAVQSLLGDHQDSVVSRAHLIQQADAARAAGEDTFIYGLLYQQEKDLADRCRARLNRALNELAEAVGERVGL